MNSIPVAELRTLLKAISDQGSQHLIEVKSDLMQTTFLLGGAIEKLSASFMEINEGVIAQQKQVDALLALAELSTDQAVALQASREKITSHINDAVTGLQFQDMTSQLITRAIKSVDSLQDSLDGMNAHRDKMDAEHAQEEIAAVLEEMSANLNTRNDALKDGLIKSVSQKDMDSGEIELF